jgi:hypothetical protein
LKKEHKKCKSCGIFYDTWQQAFLCLNCRKLKYYFRNEIPDHIPEEQIMKFYNLWKDKNGKQE